MKQDRSDLLKKMATWLNANGHLTRPEQAAQLGVKPSTLYWNIKEARSAGIEVNEMSRKTIMVVPDLPPLQYAQQPARQQFQQVSHRQAQLIPPAPPPIHR